MPERRSSFVPERRGGKDWWSVTAGSVILGVASVDLLSPGKWSRGCSTTKLFESFYSRLLLIVVCCLLWKTFAASVRFWSFLSLHHSAHPAKIGISLVSCELVRLARPTSSQASQGPASPESRVKIRHNAVVRQIRAGSLCASQSKGTDRPSFDSCPRQLRQVSAIRGIHTNVGRKLKKLDVPPAVCLQMKSRPSLPEIVFRVFWSSPGGRRCGGGPARLKRSTRYSRTI